MRVLIVGRTRMGEGLCIGAITPDFNDVRVQPTTGYAHPTAAPYYIGDLWELPLVKVPATTPPHVEDMRLSGAGHRVDRIEDVGAWLMRGIAPWSASASALFDGALRTTEAGRAYVGHEHVPDRSVGFWMPDRPLVRQEWDERTYYDYTDHGGQRWRLSYAGVAPSVRLIPAGMLVRVSLARWWSPRDSVGPELCYAQVSGWFPIGTYAEDAGVSSSSLSRLG